MIPTARRLLDWTLEMAAINQRFLDDNPDAEPIARAMWVSRRDAYLNVRCELALSLPRLIDEAWLLPAEEEVAA